MSGQPHATPVPRHRLLLALSALCSLAFVAWVLWFCGFGVDFRDEGFYFVWMTDPFKYDYSVTQFGFVYHPFFELVGHSIAGIRRLNLLATLMLAVVLADRALRSCGFEAGRLERTVLSAGLAAASLNFLHVWAPTPSYNWLALQGLMIACTGLLLADPDRQARPPAVAGVLIALGGWTCFMAKPSSAAGLAVCALLYLVVARKPVWRVLLLAGALASLLLLGSAWVIDGSLAPFVARYRIGMRMAEIMMGASNEVSILPRLRGLKLEPLTFWQFLSGVPALAAIAWMAGARSRAAGALSTLALCALALVTLLVVLGVLPGLLGQAYYRGLLLGALPLAMLAVAVLRGREGASGLARNWRGVALMLAMPGVYMLGTANDNWWQMSQAAVFWSLAAAMLAATSRTTQDATRLAPVLVVVLATQCLTTALVQSGIEAPYGQAASLRDQHRRVRIGSPGATLRLSPGYGNYLDDAQRLAREAGFAPGMPMLDLTGRSPTALHAMGASSTAAPWIIGGYPGSHPLAAAMIERAGCAELARAWLLHQPVNTTSIDAEVLEGFGARLEADYQAVATLAMSERYFGYPVQWTQQLLKPRRAPAQAEAACLAARSTKP